jgi:flagellar hook-basal body complex protein FliE
LAEKQRAQVRQLDHSLREANSTNAQIINGKKAELKAKDTRIKDLEDELHDAKNAIEHASQPAETTSYDLVAKQLNDLHQSLMANGAPQQSTAHADAPASW